MRRRLQKKKKNKKKKKSYRWIVERNEGRKREGEDVEGNERLLMGLPTKTINLRHAQYALSNIQDFPDYFLDLDMYASRDTHSGDVSSHHNILSHNTFLSLDEISMYNFFIFNEIFCYIYRRAQWISDFYFFNRNIILRNQFEVSKYFLNI